METFIGLSVLSLENKIEFDLRHWPIGRRQRQLTEWPAPRNSCLSKITTFVFRTAHHHKK